MTAIVFNCGHNGLAIIQELGRNGIPVIALDAKRSARTLSRYSNFIRCPDPLVRESKFIRFLMDMDHQSRQRPVLFPTNDHWALTIARHRKTLEERYRLCVPSFEVTSLLIEKHRFYSWSSSHDYPVPRSWKTSELSHIPKSAFPIVLKPEARRLPSDDPEMRRRSSIKDRLRFRLFSAAEDLDNFFQVNEMDKDDFIFQEFVEGMSNDMFTVGVYVDQNHRVRGLFSGRKVRGAPPDIGDCALGQVEMVPLEIKNLVVEICARLGYSGIAEFEFKRDRRTKEFKLIEVNPRSWSWIGITPAVGVSLPLIAYRDLVGDLGDEPTCCESSCADGSVKWVKLSADIPACFWKNRRQGFPDWSFTIPRWKKTLETKHLVVAEWSKDDFLPSFVMAVGLPLFVAVEIFRSAKEGLRKLVRRVEFFKR